MKWKITLLTIASVFVLSWNGYIEAAQKSFSDVSTSHWAKKEINYLVEKEVINGYPNGQFGTNDSITRAQAATMIMRSFGWGTSGEWDDPGYSDVRPGKHWAYNDIAAVYSMGIFKPTGKFQPELAVTRGEMADMLVKAFDLSSIKASKFVDLAHEHSAYKSIHILAGNQITSGYPDGTFRPDAKVTRAEFAVFMTRVFEESFRLPSNTPANIDGTIYDLEIGDQYYQLNEPLLLTDKWFAPIELFEKIGYYAQELGDKKITLTSTEGQEIELQVGQNEVWVGETSVKVEEPLKQFNGKYYIEAHGILTAMGKPLVFYPDDFLIRLESPKITAADIVKQMPQSAVDVIHSKMPYWHWSKRDRDYLELIRKNGLESKKEQLLNEMDQLTQAYFKAEKEKVTILNCNIKCNTL